MKKSLTAILSVLIITTALTSCDDASDDRNIFSPVTEIETPDTPETPANTQPAGQFKAVYTNLDADMLEENGTYVYFTSYGNGAQTVVHTTLYADTDNEFVYDDVFLPGVEDNWYYYLSTEYDNRMIVSFGYNYALGYITDWTFTNCTPLIASSDYIRGIYLYDIEENESITVTFDFAAENVTAVRTQH